MATTISGATGVQFDPQSATRISQVVKRVEQAGPPRTPAGPAVLPSASFYAKLVGASSSKPGSYSWTIVDLVNGTWTERTPRIFDSSCSATELNGATGLTTATITLMVFQGYTTAAPPTDPSPAPVAAGSGDVDLNSTGGSNTSFPTYVFAAGLLPPGGVKYQVVMRIDDAGTAGWDYPRIH